MGAKLFIPGTTPKKILLRSSLICLILALLVFVSSVLEVPRLPVSTEATRFDPAHAHQKMTELATGFPGRVTWGESRRKAALWLKEQFRELGYEPRGMFFSEKIDGRHWDGLENVYAEKKGVRRPDEIIVVTAHYDVAETTEEGAMDDASGVGVVLELARLFAKQPTDRTILFLLTDSEEFGAFWGARVFAREFERARQIVAVASFDFLAPQPPKRILTLSDGLWRGYTPLWLRELALDSIRSLGEVEAADMTHAVEFALRAIQIPAADHGAFLAAGIPAFNWVGQMDDFAFQMGHVLHSHNDQARIFSVEAFGPYGRAAERFVRSVDALPALPGRFRDSSYWKVSERHYLPGWSVGLLQLLAFVPFVAYCLARFRLVLKNKKKDQVLKLLRNELKQVGIVVAALLVGYGVLLLLPVLKVITEYESFPATQKSLLLYSPEPLALLLVTGSTGGALWLFGRLFRKPEDVVTSAEVRHAVHVSLLAFAILLAFLKNSYLAVLLLLPPAYFWIVLRDSPKRAARVVNFALLLGGAITLIAMCIIMGTIFNVGIVYWYLFLAASYGLITTYSMVLFVLVLAVMFRLFQAFVLRDGQLPGRA